jgi:hypothetical protein
MTNALIQSFRVSSTLGRTLTVSDGTNEMPRTDLLMEIDVAQRFMWWPDFVCFLPVSDFGAYHVEVWQASNVEVDSDTVRAILVPFYVSDIASVWVSGTDDRGISVPIPSGHYQLLFQNRYLTDEEMLRLPGFGESYLHFTLKPELCKLTFVPIRGEVQPQILRQDEQMRPPSELVLHV